MPIVSIIYCDKDSTPKDQIKYKSDKLQLTLTKNKIEEI